MQSVLRRASAILRDLRTPTRPTLELNARQIAADVVIAATAAVFVASRGIVGSSLPIAVTVAPGSPVRLLGLAIGALVAAPLVVRRRAPVAALAAVILIAGVAGLLVGPDPIGVLIVVAIAVYSAASYSPYEAGAMISGLAGVLALVIVYRHALTMSRPSLLLAAMVVPVALTAASTYRWHRRLEDLRAHQATVAQQAALAERTKIAADLHDIVTHNVSVMVIQAGAARTTLDINPALARSAMSAVESTGRAALDDLRQSLSLLTTAQTLADHAPGELAPTPGYRDVPDLIERTRATGLDVCLYRDGEDPTLPAGASLAIFRTVQEGITNVLKHAAGAAVEVHITNGSGLLEVLIMNGRSTGSLATPPLSGRHGLSGVRTRLAAYGGTLTAAPTAEGGYVLTATLPTGE